MLNHFSHLLLCCHPLTDHLLNNPQCWVMLVICEGQQVRVQRLTLMINHATDRSCVISSLASLDNPCAPVAVCTCCCSCKKKKTYILQLHYIIWSCRKTVFWGWGIKTSLPQQSPHTAGQKTLTLSPTYLHWTNCSFTHLTALPPTWLRCHPPDCTLTRLTALPPTWLHCHPPDYT